MEVIKIYYNSIQYDELYDAGPDSCGELIVKLFLRMKKLMEGQVIKVISYDLGAVEDVPAWCRMQGHQLLAMDEEGLLTTNFYIKKC